MLSAPPDFAFLPVCAVVVKLPVKAGTRNNFSKPAASPTAMSSTTALMSAARIDERRKP
jgi:hypothetical protein